MKEEYTGRWISFIGAPSAALKAMNDAGGDRVNIRFEDGSTLNYQEEWPFLIATQFYIIPSRDVEKK